MCNQPVSVGDLLGHVPDQLFLHSIDEVRQKISGMNHSTRFWLAVKFLRKYEMDFERHALLEFPYSHVKICSLLGVNKNSVQKKLFEGFRIADLLSKYDYLSPIEQNPKGREKFFEQIASNYNDLFASAFFKRK